MYGIGLRLLMAPMRAMRQAPRAWDADFAVPAAAPAPLLAKGDAKGDGRVASVTQDLFSAYASRAASMESSIAALTGDLEATLLSLMLLRPDPRLGS